MSGRWSYVVISFRTAKEEQSKKWTQASPTYEVLVEEEWKKKIRKRESEKKEENQEKMASWTPNNESMLRPWLMSKAA